MREFEIDAHDVSASFTLENAEEQLRGVFGDIQRDEYADMLRVTDPEALLRYVASVSVRAAEVAPRRKARRRHLTAAVPSPRSPS